MSCTVSHIFQPQYFLVCAPPRAVWGDVSSGALWPHQLILQEGMRHRGWTVSSASWNMSRKLVSLQEGSKNMLEHWPETNTVYHLPVNLSGVFPYLLIIRYRDLQSFSVYKLFWRLHFKCPHQLLELSWSFDHLYAFFQFSAILAKSCTEVRG